MCKATITATIKWKAEPARSSVHWFSGSTSGTTTGFSNVLVYIPLCITHYLLARWWRWNLVYIPGFKSFFFFILFCCCFTFCAFICVVLGRFQPKNTTRNMCLFPCWNQSFKWTELTRSFLAFSVCVSLANDAAALTITIVAFISYTSFCCLVPPLCSFFF